MKESKFIENTAGKTESLFRVSDNSLIIAAEKLAWIIIDLERSKDTRR